MFWTPPGPVVVVYSGSQLTPSCDDSSRKAAAWDHSQFSDTMQSGVFWPRSTCSHWLSAKAA